jgi:hypothetical protein
MNMSSKHVTNSNDDVDALVRAMSPQIMPTHSITGNNVVQKSSRCCWRRLSMLARCEIRASLARSDG